MAVLTLQEICDKLEQCGKLSPSSAQEAHLSLLKLIAQATSSGNVDLTPLLTELQELCDKLLAVGENTDEVEACLEELKIAVQTLNTTLSNIDMNTDGVETCLEEIKTLLEGLVTDFPADCEVTIACNEATQVYDQTITCFVDGVVDSTTVVPTTLPCTEPEPVRCDTEYVKNSATGFFDIVVTCFNQDGVEVSQTTTQSTYECPKECLEWDWINGCDLDTCTPVRWLEGVDCEGNIVFPNGPDPEYYPKDPNAGGGVVCDCIGLQSSGTAQTSVDANVSGNTLTVNNINPGGETQIQLFVDKLNAGECAYITFAQDQIGWVGEGSAVLTTTPTGVEVVITPSAPTTDGCADERAQWKADNAQTAGSASNTNVDFGGVNWGSVNYVCLSPMEGPGYDQPLDPQPTNVKCGDDACKECTPDVPKLEHDVECNTATNTWNVISTLAGVLDSVTDTGVACSEDKPILQTDIVCIDGSQNSVTTILAEDGTTISTVQVDLGIDCEKRIEVVQECINGELHNVTYQITEAGLFIRLFELATGQKCGDVQCVESQEWTYGIDNTGTNTDYDATMCIELSDGSTIEFTQTSQGATSQWTPQMAEWGANIQAAANAAGIKWFVETRCIISSGSLTGCGGFSGPPSIPVSEGLYAGGMRARYVNIQICPGQPVPTRAFIKTTSNGLRDGLELTTAGAILGPINKFWICTQCGKEPVWYLEDGITPAPAGQIPNCWEPCGTLALTDGPPDRSCEFFFDVACDNIDQTDPTNFVNLITRRVTYCSGEQVAVDFYEPDPGDPNALIEYTLVGQFVDCATGEPVEVPSPPCSDFELTTLYSLEDVTGDLRSREWNLGPRNTQLQTIEEGGQDRTSFDFSLPTTVDTTWSNLGLDDTNSDSTIKDAQVVEGYIVATEERLVRWTGGSAGYLAVELGRCCAEYELVLEAATGDNNINPTAAIVIPKGIHKIRLWNIDDWSNTSRTLQYSLDGGAIFVSDNTPPDIQLSRIKPNEVCKEVKVCKDTGAFVDLLTGEAVDPANCYKCSVLCEDNSSELDAALSTCIKGSGAAGDTTTHQIQNNNTDLTYSYNTTTLNLQGQQPFNSPDAQPAFDAIVLCIEDGGAAKITFTDQDGNQGFFEATGITTGTVGGTNGLFTGIGDTSQVQSGKVRTMVVVCCGAGEEISVVQTEGCFDESILNKLCQIESNTTQKQRIQVLPACDKLVDDSLVNIFIKYTFVQCQPVLTELFTDVQLTQVYNNNTSAGQLVDCATEEPIEDPTPLPLDSNHLVEGCIDVAGEKISAFTIVNQDGTPLFAPKPLSDLGFVECCEDV